MEADFELKCALLKKEDDLLAEILETQDALKNAVLNREWADFETLIRSMDEFGEQFTALEAERLALFDIAPDAEGKTPHFYAAISHLPENERKELSEIYRSIKDRALRARIANETLDRYLEETKATMNAFIKTAFPERKAGVYSRQGTRTSPDMRSLILDQTL
jgi:hypothetical protein